MDFQIDIWMLICTKKSFGLVLPNGWFGRPFDNRHEINEYSITYEGLSVVFDENKTLEILGMEIVSRLEKGKAGTEQLIISGFDEVIFSLPDYDGKRKSMKFAKGGEVSLFGYFK